MTWQEDLAARLLQLRRREGISQEELAELAGVSRQAVSKWESAQSVPETEKLLTISEHFNVSMDWLLKGEEPQPEPQAAAPRGAFNGRLALVNATLLIWCGLLVGWAVWAYWQNSWGAIISLIMLALAAGVFSMGLYEAGAAEKQRLQYQFCLLNVWPVVMLLESVAACIFFGLLNVQPLLLCPVFTRDLMFVVYAWAGGGGPFLLLGIWLIICVTVFAGARRGLRR